MGKIRGHSNSEQTIRIAVVGDSLTTDFRLSNLPSSFWRARRLGKINWFNFMIEGLNTKFQDRYQFRGLNFASVSAKVDSGETKSKTEKLIGTKHFSNQVTQILSMESVPDLILFWIGHNNLNWVERQHEFEGDRTKLIREISDNFIQLYRNQAKRLFEAAKQSSRPTCFAVMGLLNISGFFEARAEAEALHIKNPYQFPYFKKSAEQFESMKPIYQQTTIKLVNHLNQELSQMVVDFQKDRNERPQILYSPAMFEASIHSAGHLSAKDAWHPSMLAHKVFAEAVLTQLRVPHLQM